MQYLIHCPCGHALSRHGDDGCRGSRSSRCVCARSPVDAFDALVRYLAERSALGDRDCPMPSEPRAAAFPAFPPSN
ncbi:MAG TPA: hypothetical protein VFB22_18040 [Candidatus Baltobacteraceae bacterium]|nr:hypothetical protein [Candidatus Baltobacteraceae bacterium]